MSVRRAANAPAIALLPWGDVIEDWTWLRVSVDRLAEELAYGWIAGFADALNRTGVRTVLVLMSSHVSTPTRAQAAGIPATIWILPEPRSASIARRARLNSSSLPARIYNVPLRRARPYLSTPPRMLAGILRSEGCTAILCQEYESPRFDCCVVLGRVLGIPTFATFQGVDWTANRIPEGTVRAITTRCAAGFIVGSDIGEFRLRDKYRVKQERIAVIPNPIDSRYWEAEDRSRAREQLGIDEDALVVAWHGRVEVQTKGLDWLVSAWPRVTASSTPGSRQLWLLGDGDDAADLRTMLSPLDPRTVTWKSEFVTNTAEVRTFISAADISVLCSRREGGTPVAALEAMSCARPVLATSSWRAEPVLTLDDGRVAGLIVEPNPADIAAGLSRLLEDADLRNRTAAWAREQVQTKFDTNVVAPRLSAFFTSDHVRQRFL